MHVPVPALDPNRSAHMAARLGDSPRTMPVPAWPRPDKELPVVNLEVAWVCFSTINHRTQAEQIRERRRSGRDDLFARSPLGKEAQDAQYGILREQDGFAELKEDLKARGQREPAIVTADGVLINGNRRSAAMRSLFVDDDVRSARYVRCLVLPSDATTAELVDLETELQVAKDFKQNYSWINEALLIEELYERENKNFKRVAERVHRTVADVRASYEKIQQVHQLVALSQGTREYVDFTPNESAFDELAKHIKNKPEAEAQSVKDVYFIGTLTGVEYRNLRHLRRPDAAALVLDEIRSDSRLEAVLKEADKSSGAGEGDDDLLDVFLDDGTSDSEPLSSLLQLVASTDKEGTVELGDGSPMEASQLLNGLRRSITNAATEAKEDTRDRKEVTAPLERADMAIGELGRMIQALPRARRYNDWDETAFASKVEQLERLLLKVKEQS
ncbi:hypothetical protein AB0C94_23625 [Streptomyces griseus]|uniref:hypothetical protein n=1 Tax=Streptomyces griseus TaxID=1911 RepID=UPI00331D21FD